MKKNPKQDNLKTVYFIEKILKKNGYFDVSRISREILDYCNEHHLSLDTVLERIETKEPWEYIKGKSDFHGLELIVNKNTLIPRVETEQLVDIAVDYLEGNKDIKYVVDVGTGTGCIIIFLAKKLCKKKNLTFLATDANSKALEVAKKNSVLHKVNKKVSFLKANLLKGVKIDGSFLMIANLPYIPTEMYLNLDMSVRDFEPRDSLDGGKDGLKYYKKLLEQIEDKNLNTHGGFLLMEIEPSTLASLKPLLQSYSGFRVIKDFRGLNRFVLVHFG